MKTHRKVRDPDIVGSEKALKRAARRAREIARATNTPLVIYEHGRVVYRWIGGRQAGRLWRPDP